MKRRCPRLLAIVLLVVAGCQKASLDEQAWIEERSEELFGMYWDALYQQKDADRAEEVMRELIEMKHELPEKYRNMVEPGIAALSPLDPHRPPVLLKLWKEQE